MGKKKKTAPPKPVRTSRKVKTDARQLRAEVSWFRETIEELEGFAQSLELRVPPLVEIDGYGKLKRGKALIDEWIGNVRGKVGKATKPNKE